MVNPMSTVYCFILENEGLQMLKTIWSNFQKKINTEEIVFYDISSACIIHSPFSVLIVWKFF